MSSDRYGYCEAKNCTQESTSAVFTAPVSTIDTVRRRGMGMGRTNAQPRWFCTKHAQDGRAVDSFTGGKADVIVKSYVAEGRKLKPLPKNQQYKWTPPKKEVKN